MFKVLFCSFSTCRHKQYHILSINKNVPCFVMMITGYFKVYTIQDKAAQGLKFSNSKLHNFKFIRDRYTNSMLAIIPGTLLSQKFYHFFSSVCFAFFSFI